MNPSIFPIRSLSFGELHYTKVVPDSLICFILPTAHPVLAYCPSGYILIQEIRGLCFSLWHHTILLSQEDTFQVRVHQSVISLNVCLENSFSFSREDQVDSSTFYEGQYNLSYFPTPSFTAKFNAQKVYSYATLLYSFSSLSHCAKSYPILAAFLTSTGGVQPSFLYPLCPYSTKQLRKILFGLLRVDCNDEMISQQIKDGKALELLVRVLEHYPAASAEYQERISNQDAEKIYSAREWLNDQKNRPVSLYELSKKVGLNVHKLNIGFQKIIGTTVFDYHRKIRMDHASQLLEKTDRDLFDIGTEIGYMDGKSFSKEFKKIKGVPPLEYRKQTRIQQYVKN